VNAETVSRQFWSSFVAGVGRAAGLPSLVLMASLIGVGGLTRDIGYPMFAGVLSTILIWAGPAQVLLFGSIAAGASMPAIAIAVSLSSIRFFPMVVSIVPLLRAPDVGICKLLLGAHFVAVTSWTEGRRLLPGLPVTERFPFFIGFASMVMAAASFATGVGYYLIGALPAALAAALLFTTPMFFTLSLVAGSRTPADWAALILGFSLAPLSTFVVGQDFDLLVVGLIGGSAAYVLHRTLRKS
jgi:predicted branched-subunit amino acid permease